MFLSAPIFNASQLFIYNWPAQEDADLPAGVPVPIDPNEAFLLQEQISEYLGVKSFKRKYPGMYLIFFYLNIYSTMIDFFVFGTNLHILK
jgi:hypothetical protein